MTASDIVRIVLTVSIVQIICDLLVNWRIYYQKPYQRAIANLHRAKSKWLPIKIQQQQQNDVVSTANTTTTTNAGKKKFDKNIKKNQRIEDDYKQAVADVSRRHIFPNMINSIVFILLLKILSTDYSNQIIAILPFTPWYFIRKITLRGLQFVSSTDDNTNNIPFDVTTLIVKKLQQQDHDQSLLLDEMENPTKRSLLDKEINAGQACSFFMIYILCNLSIKYYLHKLFGVSPPTESNGLMSIIDSPTGQKLMKAAGVNPNDLPKFD